LKDAVSYREQIGECTLYYNLALARGQIRIKKIQKERAHTKAIQLCKQIRLEDSVKSAADVTAPCADFFARAHSQDP